MLLIVSSSTLERQAFARYVTDGRLPIANNAGERAPRRAAIVRKNWMFLGNENGGRTAAILYRLVKTWSSFVSRAHDDPSGYGPADRHARCRSPEGS